MKFIDKDGRKREGLEKRCEVCSISFLTRIDQPAKFCSKECSYKSRHKRINLICTHCEKSFERKLKGLKNSKSGLYFCTRKCKDIAQRLGGIKEIQPAHYGTAPFDYRTIFTEFVCHRCGYKEFDSCVDVHHIDHNRENNDISNLILLCSCCHQAYHRGRLSKLEVLQKL